MAQVTVERWEAMAWPLSGPVAALSVTALSLLYLRAATGDEGAASWGVALLSISLMAALALSARRSGSPPMAALALVLSVTMAARLAPSNSAHMSAAVVLLVSCAGAAAFPKLVDMPPQGRVDMRAASALTALALPIAMGFAQALFVGYRFTESFGLGGVMGMMFVPFVALWGFVEEALFRGIVLRSMLPYGARAALVSSAALNAVAMLVWGSVPLAAYSFLSALVFGRCYLRTRSVAYVGGMHALQDTWLIMALMLLNLT